MSTFRKFWETKPRMDYVEFLRDFISTNDWLPTDWTSTKTGAATDVVSVGAGASGVLVITNTAALNDVAYHQNKLEVFRFDAGKALEFEARFKLADALNTIAIVGLQITDATPNAVSDGVFFRTDAAKATVDFIVCKDGAEQRITLPDPLSNNTWVKLGFYYDGGNTVDAFVNDVRVGALKTTNLPTTVPLDDAELLTVSFGAANGTAAAAIMSVDYIRAVQQR